MSDELYVGPLRGLPERHPAYGRTAACGFIDGEEYVWFVGDHGEVAMMPMACLGDWANSGVTAP